MCVFAAPAAAATASAGAASGFTVAASTIPFGAAATAAIPAATAAPGNTSVFPSAIVNVKSCVPAGTTTPINALVGPDVDTAVALVAVNISALVTGAPASLTLQLCSPFNAMFFPLCYDTLPSLTSLMGILVTIMRMVMMSFA